MSIRIQQVIGDEYEGTRLYRPLNGLEIDNLTRNHSGMLNAVQGVRHQSARNLHLLHEPFVYRGSEKPIQGRRLCGNFQSARLHPSLARCASRGSPAGKKARGPQGRILPAGRCAGNVWALPELIITTKLKCFEYQNEYRLSYTTTDAFAFQNCTYQLVDRKARPSPKPEEHHYQTLELGSLRDICRIHSF